jgi:hypothetical protein
VAAIARREHRAMASVNGTRALLATLKAHDITTYFSNPGI